MECAAISSLQRQIAEWGLALVLAWLCASARAQSPDPTKTGRPMQGVNASATYDGETVSDLSGGAKRGSTYHGSLQLQAAFDFERLFGWADTTGFLYGMGLHGGQPDDFTGGAQGVSSITGPRGARLDEAWLQHNFLGNRLSLLGGRYDLNDEFYRLHSAALFLNSSFGMGPEFSQSGPAWPSVFPSTAVAARVQYKPTPDLVLLAALMRGPPDNRAGSYAGAVLVALGLFPGPQNEVGIAIASARNGSRYREQQEQLGTPAQRSEAAVELSYLAQISKSVAVQPDLQYIVHPNTDPAIGNALALLLRFEVSF